MTWRFIITLHPWRIETGQTCIGPPGRVFDGSLDDFAGHERERWRPLTPRFSQDDGQSRDRLPANRHFGKVIFHRSTSSRHPPVSPNRWDCPLAIVPGWTCGRATTDNRTSAKIFDRCGNEGDTGFRRLAAFLTENHKNMIRPTEPGDTPVLLDIARGTHVFKALEIVALNEVLDDYHATMRATGHISVTCEEAGQIVGFAYYAPAAMTDRTWYLYWIAVDKQSHARGIGGKLLRHAEEDVRRGSGRLLLIETSSLPHYELTRRFYLKHGYDQACVLDSYYADGDDLVVFRKRFIADVEV